MTFYLIGLGLDVNSISARAIEIIKKCDKVYLESYTVDFPYDLEDLEFVLGKKIASLNREDVESEGIVSGGKKGNVALLVYGNPLSATTHISLILKAKKSRVKWKVIHSESVLTAISESGLQLYKFGKTASMPKFAKSFEPDSFLDIIEQNLEINAHTLLLTDIGLSSKEAIKQLKDVAKKRKMGIDKIILCSRVGTDDSRIYYDTLEKLEKIKIAMPFCMIIPSGLHFVEEEALDALKEKC